MIGATSVVCTVFNYFKPEFPWTLNAFPISLLLVWFAYFIAEMTSDRSGD